MALSALKRPRVGIESHYRRAMAAWNCSNCSFEQFSFRDIPTTGMNNGIFTYYSRSSKNFTIGSCAARNSCFRLTGQSSPKPNQGERDMNSNQQLTLGAMTAAFPPLRQPKAETVDRGAVRLGDSCITAAFPPLRQPRAETADRGAVRLGDSCITAALPPLRQPKAETADRGAVRLGDSCITAAFPPLR
jgi:hypothetical protein